MKAASPFFQKFRGSNNEGVLGLVLLAVVIGMTFANPKFFSLNTLFQVIFNSMVPLVFALAVLLVMISGGIDVSFAAVAIFSAYTTVTILEKLKSGGGPIGIWAWLAAFAIGAMLGLINGVIIARFSMPTLIATLGTQTIFWGALLSWVGTAWLPNLPAGMNSLTKARVLNISSGFIHVFTVPILILVFVIAFILKRTMFGRSLYAIGGDVEGARRVGIKVVKTQLILYMIVGVIAAFGGMISVIISGMANPQTLVGSELDTIAAVVLGGASIFGGRGSVVGTVLGVVLINVIENSLLLIGVPTAWQRAAVGILLVVGLGLQALAASRAKQSRALVITQEVAA